MSQTAQINHSAVFVGPAMPVEFWESPIANAPEGGMIVRVGMAGVCGTDAHRLAGDVPLKGHPICFGHEGVGTVEELGPGVATDWAGHPLRLGDAVYWNPSRGCGRCYACTVQLNTAACPNLLWPPPASEANPAAFQDFAALDASVPVYRIPEETPPEAVIAFGCAMPTALSGQARLGKIHPGQTVVVQGDGPVGLASALLARLSPARQVIVIGGTESRLAAARKLGADLTLSISDTTLEERAAIIHDLTDGHGADVVIEAAGVLPAFDEGINLLGVNGRYVIEGLYSGTGSVALDPYRLNNLSITICGSLGGDATKFPRTLAIASQYHQQLRLAELVTHRYPLDELEQAVAAMKSGEAVKAVLVPRSSAMSR